MLWDSDGPVLGQSYLRVAEKPDLSRKTHARHVGQSCFAVKPLQAADRRNDRPILLAEAE